MRLCINTTMDCNLRCKYCYLKHKGYKKQIMSKETAFRFIDNCNKLYNNKITLHFYGGEPLLNFNLIKEIINKYNNKFDYIITSNGTLINKEIAQLMIKNNFEIHISFDGSKKVQNSQRSGKKGEETFFVLDRIKLFREYNNCIINIVTTTKNVNKLYQSYKALIKSGIKNIKIMEDIMDIWDNDSIKKLDQQYSKIINNYTSIKYNENRITIQSLEYYDPNETCEFNMNHTLSIFPDNEVYICGCECIRNNKEFRIGNINDNDFFKKLEKYNFGINTNEGIYNFFKNKTIINLSKIKGILLCDILNNQEKSCKKENIINNRIIIKNIKEKYHNLILSHKNKN